MNNEQKRMCGCSCLWLSLRYCSCIFLEGLRKKSQKKSQFRWPVYQYLNIEPPSHEAGVLFSSANGMAVARTLQCTLSWANLCLSLYDPFLYQPLLTWGRWFLPHRFCRHLYYNSAQWPGLQVWTSASHYVILIWTVLIKETSLLIRVLPLIQSNKENEMSAAKLTY